MIDLMEVDDAAITLAEAHDHRADIVMSARRAALDQPILALVREIERLLLAQFIRAVVMLDQDRGEFPGELAILQHAALHQVFEEEVQILGRLGHIRSPVMGAVGPALFA